MARSFLEQALFYGTVLFPVRAVLSLDVGMELLIAIGPDAALDRSGLDQGHLDTTAGNQRCPGSWLNRPGPEATPPGLH